jgi:hypothetical protein
VPELYSCQLKLCFLFYRQKKEYLLFLLIESGANTSQKGWMQIGDESMFGSPLLLTIWFQEKFGSSETSDKIFQIIYNDYEKNHSLMATKGNCFQFIF